jgi:hypothetical protein
MEIVASQPCWVIENGTVRLAVTQIGAQMAPVTFFLNSDRTIEPYCVSPWQGEGLRLDPPVLVPLRGDFFCLPFGSNGTPCEGLTFVSVTGKKVTVPVNFEFARTGKL